MCVCACVFGVCACVCVFVCVCACVCVCVCVCVYVVQSSPMALLFPWFILITSSKPQGRTLKRARKGALAALHRAKWDANQSTPTNLHKPITHPNRPPLTLYSPQQTSTHPLLSPTDLQTHNTPLHWGPGVLVNLGDDRLRIGGQVDSWH